jgi:hypothetical protein
MVTFGGVAFFVHRVARKEQNRRCFGGVGHRCPSHRTESINNYSYSYNVVNTDGPRITCALSLHPQPKSCQDPFGMTTKTATTTD